jgi:hypothetical protein
VTRFGLDSTSEVPAGAHHAVGSTVALRYLSRSSWKVVTRAEHERYQKAGISLALVFEDEGRPDLEGYDAGKADAELALRQALDILGTPAQPPVIRFAFDSDPTGRAALSDAYYDGVAAVLTHDRSGPYGGYEICAHAAARGFKSLWQTYAWSAGRFFLGSTLFQYANGHTVGGVGVDFNHVYGHDFGQWDRQPSVPPDPHHYLRFDTTPRELAGHTVSELAAVTEYDHLRKHPFLHRPRLHVLRGDLALLAGRVSTVARQDTPPSWLAFHRGWRYQALIHRAQGQRLA